jgi:hypothetical protein
MGSTFGSELFRRRKSLVGGSLIALNSGSGGGASSKMDQNGGPLGGGMIVDPEPPPDLATHRFLRVFYQLSVRVKTGGLFQLFSDYRKS